MSSSASLPEQEREVVKRLGPKGATYRAVVSATVASLQDPRHQTDKERRDVWVLVQKMIRKLVMLHGFVGGDILNVTVADTPLSVPDDVTKKRRNVWLYRVNLWRVQ